MADSSQKNMYVLRFQLCVAANRKYRSRNEQSFRVAAINFNKECAW